MFSSKNSIPIYNNGQICARERPNEDPDGQKFYSNVYYKHDIIHGKMKLSHATQCITKHRYFQRLKDIHQLGPLYFKFPSGAHSRYEHSIGVAFLARFTSEIQQTKIHTITQEEILCVEIAGLCHDLGHGAFSHSFDHLLRDSTNKTDIWAHHEARSMKLTERMLIELNTEGLTHFSMNDIRLIQYFIDSAKFTCIYADNIKYTIGLEQIVSNVSHKVDVDKMDYLLRDSLMLRVDSVVKSVNILDVLQRSLIVDGVWMFHATDQGIIYDLICRRFIFYTNYYLHPDVNAVSCMITDAMKIVDVLYGWSKSAQLETKEDFEQFILLTDNYYLEFITNSDNPKIVEAQKVLSRIFENKWYSHLGDFVTQIENLDNTNFCDFPWEVFTDRSTPTNLLPKVRYHLNGMPIEIAKNNNITLHRIFHK